MDDLAHMTQLRVQLGAAEHLSVHAAQTHAAPAQLCHKVFVHLTGQHLLHDLHGGIVRHPQTVGEAALHAHLFQHLVDSGAAAVHQHHPHAQQRQGDKVVHHGVFQALVDHGVAAVLDDHGSAMVFLDIRGGLRKKPRHFFVFHILSLPPTHLLRHLLSTRQTPSVIAARCHLPQGGRLSGPLCKGAVAAGDWGSSIKFYNRR